MWQRSNYIPGMLVLLMACRGLTTNDVTSGASEAYPELKSIHAGEPPRVAFARVESVAMTMESWDNCEVTDTWTLHCEAVTGTFEWVDDVWITVQKNGPKGSTISMRSASRVGKGDFGANARRIREFQMAYEAFTPGALPD